MGGKSKAKKPKQGPKPPAQDTVQEPEFTKIVDIRDPWKGEEPKKVEVANLKDPWEGKTRKEVEVPKKKEHWKNTELGKAEVVPKDSFTERIRILRARMEEREQSPTYHRGNIATRPRKTKLPPLQYVDRLSRLGSVAGIRPQKKKKNTRGEEENVMVFTPKELYGKEETKRMAKLDAKKKKKPKKKEGS